MDKLNTFGQTKEMETEGDGKVSSQGLSIGTVEYKGSDGIQLVENLTHQ